MKPEPLTAVQRRYDELGEEEQSLPVECPYPPPRNGKGDRNWAWLRAHVLDHRPYRELGGEAGVHANTVMYTVERTLALWLQWCQSARFAEQHHGAPVTHQQILAAWHHRRRGW